jgi:hypothetical protein
MKFTTILLWLPKRHACSSYFSASAIHLQYEDDGDGGGGDVSGHLVGGWDSGKDV